MTGSQYGHKPPPDFSVDLPAGGKLFLHSLDEMELWEESSKRYIADYQLTQQNDLLLLGAILSQQLAMFRAQQRMNGTSPELDAKGAPTGNYLRKELKISDMGAAQSTIVKASVEIRELEKALGVDKKAQPLDAKLLTPDGWTTMGEVQLGDMVIGSGGTAVAVTGVHPQGLCDIWRVRFTDGSSVECDGDHLWAVACAWHERKGVRLVKRTSEIAATLGPGKHFGGAGNPWRAPRAPRVDFAVRCDPLSVHPYVLGALLGDGGLSRPGTVNFHNVDEPVWDAVRQRLPDSVELVHYDAGNGRIRKRDGARAAPNELLDQIRELGLHGTRSHTKFIPRNYLLADASDRLELLAGLVDTDGHVTKRTGGVMYATASDQLADDVQFLVRSLGLRCGRSRIKPQRGGYTNGQPIVGRGGWALTFRVSEDLPLRHPLRIASARGSRLNRDRLSITAIEPVGRKPARCISVDAEDGLYVTDDFVLTHNTREAGGAHTVQNYVATLKKAAREYGLQLSKRMKEYERVMMEARWKLRLLRNGDAEDRSYHKLTPQTVCDWLEGELAALEELDKQFARDKHAVFVGRF